MSTENDLVVKVHIEDCTLCQNSMFIVILAYEFKVNKEN